MTHLMVDVTDFEIVGDYTLRVGFDDGTTQMINFEPVLYGYYLAPLRDQQLFNQVYLDPHIRTLVWPNGADFDPATLHDWHKGDGAELAERAQRWQYSEGAKRAVFAT
ncbi:MAG: DUF2442 domain-containing protein [Ardenticatenaceae bacterium]